MNKVLLTGNLVKDIDVKTIGKTVVANFVIANNRGFGENKKTSFIRCALFGESRVEALEKYLVTGVGVIIEGELDVVSKEVEEGEYITFTSVIVDKIEITKYKNNDDEQEEKPKYKKKGRK